MLPVLIGIVLLALVVGLIGFVCMDKPRKLEPHEYEWGRGKDLSALMPTPISELERWWNSEKSKDAQIKKLESKVADLKDSLDFAEKKGIYYHPSRALPMPLSYTPTKVSLLPRDLADTIMNPDSNSVIYLTIRNGRVVDWHSEEGPWV